MPAAEDPSGTPVPRVASPAESSAGVANVSTAASDVSAASTDVSAAEVKTADAAPPASRTALYVKLGLVVAVAIGLVVAWRLGALQVLGDRQRLKDYLLGLGSTGYIVFVVAFAFLQPFGVPGFVFMVTAALIWPWPVAFGLSMAGGVLCTIVGFGFARFIARDFVQRRLPPKFKKYDQRLADHAFATVLLLRLVFWCHPILHAFMGTSKVKFWTHLLASTIAYVIPFFVVSFFGQRVVDLVSELEVGHWIVIALVIGKVALVTWGVTRYVKKRLAARRASAAI